MSLPGFTAEASAYKTSNSYYGISRMFPSGASGAVFPQQSMCEDMCLATRNRCRRGCDDRFNSCRQQCPPCLAPGRICTPDQAPPCCNGDCIPILGGIIAVCEEV